MKQFRLVDNVVGWVAFMVAAFVYCSTIEPTASFWDCPEFITTGYKMEIGHPPGAPFFMLTANLFSQLVSDPSQVARMVNTMSALLSATCIMFLYWTITHLTRRLLIDRWEELTTPKLIAIEASGLVGALIYTFSDTFWYSAVEGEVYAYSSAFTAVVFWLILKWEDQADQPHSDRWLVLIMYMTGLSIGVHLLNLLCLPAIVLVYYYKRFPNANLKGSIVALLISFVIVAAVLYGVVPGIITVGGWFELLFVNTLHMPFNTGEYIYLLLLVGIVIWAIYETQCSASTPAADKKSRRNWTRQNIAFLLSVGMLGIPFYGYGWSAAIIGILLLAALWYILQRRYKQQPLISAHLKNTMLLCMLMLMIGYSTYAVIVIRSSANPPMDQNSPEDIFTLGNYLSRDQYGYRPLFYGQAYTSEYQVTRDGHVLMDEGAPVYERREKKTADEPDSYFVAGRKEKPLYQQNMFFPRMYSSAHTANYEAWMGDISSNERPSTYRDGDVVKIPTQWENLRFFITYQCNWMYWRYFLWNFAGRQNDIQGHGNLEHGNWLSGIPFIDNWRLGNQNNLPDDLKTNKGHNVFYCLPLLLGLIGLFWQVRYRGLKGVKQFWVVFFLFFMTGLAIVVYLNQTPMQPRERDYAYAGSFYAFAIWCGMGVAAIIDYLGRLAKKQSAILAAIVSVACLAVPLQMASQTWDDHDRSDRYTCRDFGQNYLMSLQQEGNPVIFTNGDNDTFPLWYNQDTEGVRTDARVCNLSYLQTDWYIDQMLRPAYDSPGLPITWSRLEYVDLSTNGKGFIGVEPSMKTIIDWLYQQYPDDAKQLFGDDPYELKNILKYWVRELRDPKLRETQKKVVNFVLSKVGGSNFDIDLNVIPTDTIYMTVDKEAVRRSGMMIQGDSIPDRMVISLKGKRALGVSDLMMLEMLAHANWERPLYVATTVGSENYMNLGENFVQEGLACRITPYKTRNSGLKDFDAEKTYDNVMNRFKFGGVSTPGIYLDETVMRMCYTHRRLLSQLAIELARDGKKEKAAKVLELAARELPADNVPHDFQSGSLDIIEAYILIGDKKHAREVLEQLWHKSEHYAQYYISLHPSRFNASRRECQLHLALLSQHLTPLAASIDSGLHEKCERLSNILFDAYLNRGGTFN